MRLIILSLCLLLSGCSTIRVPVYEPPKPVYVAKDTLRPIFTVTEKDGYKVKSEAIVKSYAQCEARMEYLESLKP